MIVRGELVRGLRKLCMLPMMIIPGVFCPRVLPVLPGVVPVLDVLDVLSMVVLGPVLGSGVVVALVVVRGVAVVG